ncbi:MAG: hypothetical protein CMJ49_12110 [Planctomycetaceae bacterium]|nr:hypothetical protein [Planctomycetaceae bacterium]
MPVVQEVSVPVQAGRVHALIGPNASGKTTLVKLMLGLLRPWRGRVRLGGRPARRVGGRARASTMSYVPQRSSVNFAFSVRQVVALGRFALQPDDQAVESALEDCDLADLGHRPYTELSVGQQQRVLLARAIAQSAGAGRVMLLDEPTSAMDPAHVHRLMAHVRRLAVGGLAVVMVMHDLNLAARYADEVWVMEGGRIVAGGSWDVVLTPEVLEPIYQVSIRAVMVEGDGDEAGTGASVRPVFDVRLPPAPDGA